MTPRAGPRLAAYVVVASLAAGCVPASPDPSTYDSKAVLTLGSAVSETRTVQQTVLALDQDRTFRTVAKTQLRYSEDALDTATGAFTELNPPPERDRLHAQVTTLLGDAGDLLARTRIAVERDRSAQYPALSRQLGRIADRMQRLEERVP